MSKKEIRLYIIIVLSIIVMTIFKYKILINYVHILQLIYTIF